MTTIIKNTTASSIFIQDVGFVLPANSSNTIEDTNKALWANSESIAPFIVSGDIVINDGVNDLSSSDGARFLKWPDRIIVKLNNVDVTRVVTSINVAGNATVTDNGNGAVTVNVNNISDTQPHLREVTMQVVPGVGFLDVSSNLLYIPEPENDTIEFLIEEDE